MNQVAEKKYGRLFHGWWIVLIAGSGLSLGYVPVIGFTFSVFFNPLSQEFHWTRSQVSLGFSVSLLVLSVVLPLAGRLVDRIAARKVILPAAVLMGLGLTCFYFLSGTLWHFYAIYALLGIAGGGTISTPYFKVISHWFDKRRGIALGLAMGGTGLGALFMPILAHSLIEAMGWRAAYVVIGLLVIVVTLPVVGVFLKEKPEMMGLLPDGELLQAGEGDRHERDAKGMTRREAWRSGPFWFMSTSFFLVSASLNGCLIHLVPLLTDRGVSAQQAALAISLLGGATLLGRVGTGFLLDRFRASYVAVGVFCGGALGILLLWAQVPLGLAFLAAFLVGVGIGAEGDLMAYLIGRYFGLRAFGEISGYMLTIYTLGAMLGPYVMGAGYDSLGSYGPVLSVFVVTVLLAAVLMIRLRPYGIEPVAIRSAAD